MSITDSVHIQRSPLVVTRDMWPEWSVSRLGSTFKKQTGISHSLSTEDALVLEDG